MSRRRAVIAWILSAVVVAAAPGGAFAQGAPSAAASSDSQPPSKTATTVKSVTVTGRKDEVRISPDKRSYDITGDLHATTGSVADALRNVPSVEVTPDGTVSIRGDQSVVIYVDGKPSALFKGPQTGQVLQSLPADQYERVEVMTNPSAAYAPDGSAGIINLVTKKDRKPGRSGSVRVADGVGGRRNASVTANQKSGPLTFGFNAGLRHDRYLSTGTGRQETVDPSGGPVSALDTASRISNVSDSASGRGYVEWNPDTKTQVTAELDGFDGRFHNALAFRWLAQDGSGAPPRALDRTGANANDYAAVEGGLTLRRSFEGDDHTLLLSLTQDRSTSDGRQAYTLASLTPPAPDSYQDLRRAGDTGTTHLKGDYTRPLPHKAQLKTGFDLSSEADDVNRSGFLAAAAPTAPDDPGQSDRFRFKRRISAVYATYQQPLGPFDVLAGLRGEATAIEVNDLTSKSVSHPRDDRLYPSLHLGYKLSERQRLTAGASERVQRPGADQFNPFRSVNGPFAVSAGNPDLKPQQTRKLELEYEYRRGDTYYLATAYDTVNTGGVATIARPLGGDVVLSTFENLARSRNSGLELSASRRLFKRLKYNVSANAYRNEFDGAPDLGFAGAHTALILGGRAGLDWDVDAKDLLQLQVIESGKQLTAQGYFSFGPYMRAGWRHKFNDRFALLVTAEDELGDSRFAVEAPTIRNVWLSQPHAERAFVSLSWSFGGGSKRDPDFEYGQGK